MEDYALGLYEKSMPGIVPLAAKLAAAGAAGFDYLELSIDETDEKLARLDWTEGQIRALRADIDATGVPIGSICLSGHRKYPLGHPSAEVRERSLSIMAGAARLAARLGARLIQIAGYDVYYEPSTGETRAFFGENLARSALIAAREGVVLAFETMETPFMDTTDKAMGWVRRVDSPYLHVYPDTGNITNAAKLYGTDAAADLKTGAGRVAAVHLKESRPGAYRDVPYGTGHVEFGRLAAVARSLGVRRFVGEFWHAGEADWEGTLRSCNAFLRGAIEGKD